MNDVKTVAYLYKWTHILTNKWYIGSKSSVGCHPIHHEKYICSSHIVKPLIKANRQEWVYEILCIGEPKYIRKLETLYLCQLDAKNDIMSYNQNNAHFDPSNRSGIKESISTKLKKSEARKGSKNPMYGKKGSLSPHFGKKYSEERRKNISKSLTGRTHSEEHRQNLKISLTNNPKLGMPGKLNPQYGKPASDAAKRGSTLKNSGVNNPMKKLEHQRTCEYCNKTIAKNHYTMFHGLKCKSIIK